VEPPLKVHSHRRSGTHLLMATLAENFELGDLSIEVDVPGQRWHASGEARAVVPWGRLFGDHEPYLDTRASPERILYIVRDPRDTLDSLWRFEAPATPLGQFLTLDRIRHWHRHASGYCARVFWIRFEDLTGDRFESVMAEIAGRFGLRSRAPEVAPGRGGRFRRIREPVGWSPGPGRQGWWRDWPAEWRARFAAVIPAGFLGYPLP
jgi:hypothetical protein